MVRGIEYRSVKIFDKFSFNPWDTAHVFDDVNDIWSHWENLLKQAIDNGAPSKLVCVKGNHLPWIKQTIEKQIRFRNHLYGKFRRSKTSDNWNNYRFQRTKVTVLKGQAAKDFCSEAASFFF